MDAGAIGRAIFLATDLPPLAPVRRGAVEIARRLKVAIYQQPHAHDEARLATWAGQTHVVLRRGMEPRRANFLIAQMLARYFIVKHAFCPGLSGERLAELERRTAAWLVAPPEPFRVRYSQVGIDFDALAQPFAITRTTAALRLTEVVDDIDLVVVFQQRRPIRRCRTLLGRLPDEDLQALATKRHTRSVRKISLREDGGAVALLQLAG